MQVADSVGMAVLVRVVVKVAEFEGVDDADQGERDAVLVGVCDAPGVRVVEGGAVRVNDALALHGERVAVAVGDRERVCVAGCVRVAVVVAVLLRLCGGRDLVCVPVPVLVLDRVRVCVGEGGVHGQKRRNKLLVMAVHVPTPPPYKHWPFVGSYSGLWGRSGLPGSIVQKEPVRPALNRISFICAAFMG